MIRTVFDAHAVEPELQRVLIEQVPRVGGMREVDASQLSARDVVLRHLQVRRAEIAPRDLELAAFAITRSIRALAHAALTRPDLLGNDALLDEATALVLGYLRAPVRRPSTVDRPEPPPPRKQTAPEGRFRFLLRFRLRFGLRLRLRLRLRRA